MVSTQYTYMKSVCVLSTLVTFMTESKENEKKTPNAIQKWNVKNQAKV